MSRLNMSPITPQIWVGGSIADETQMEMISNMGFTDILNLEAKDDSPLLDGYVGLLHIQYLHLPVADATAKWKPTFVRAGIEFVTNALARKGKVYVHCTSGISRSASMVYGVLRAQELTPDDAKAKVLAGRPQAQLDYVKDIESALKRYPNIGQNA